MIADIGAADIRDYIATCRKEGAAPGTINKENGFASAAWSWVRREFELPIGSPWTSRRLREPAGRRRWLTHDEANRLLAAAREAKRAPHLQDWMMLCLYAGLRPGEALGLDWERVDLRRRTVRFEAEDQKSGKPASLPLNKRACAAVAARARFRAQFCPDPPRVFCRRDGTRIESINRSFAAAVRAAGLEDVHPHDMRRMFASWLVQDGVGIDRLSQLLRYADVRMTAADCAHLRPSDLADAASVLDGPAELSRSSRSRSSSRDEDPGDDGRRAAIT